MISISSPAPPLGTRGEKWPQRWAAARCWRSAALRMTRYLFSGRRWNLAHYPTHHDEINCERGNSLLIHLSELLRPVEADVDAERRQADADDQDGGGEDVDLGRDAALLQRPDLDREGLLDARVQVRDDEVVERQGEGEQGGGEDARQDQRERHPPEDAERFGPEVQPRPLEPPLEAADARPYRRGDVADGEHD